MIVISSIIVMAYAGLVMYCARKVSVEQELRAQEKVFEESVHSQKLANKKESLFLEKMRLENETLEIFTLYELTKDITKSLSEQEAFEIFKNTLSRHGTFEECLLVHPLSHEIKDYKKSEDYFVFVLQGEKKKTGYLVIKGLAEANREKFMILGNQFALAFRRVKLYQEIERIAITDSLTEIYTRRYALGRLQEEIRRSKMRGSPLSFLMIDADFFKDFNDTYGHLTGDQILREVGRLIRENIREIDVAGRYGGEEFCVILPDTDREGARFVAERIRQAAEGALVKAYDTQVKVTLSIGVSTYPEDGLHMEELIDKSDWALYRAKKEGRNRVCAFGVYRG
ncbi:MAG: hypothetical protein A3G91_01835 [Omnitrophica WOR_2 bacterium RIFCSPLOWO2_12_FULL_50_9]|nr:MAG: hypothetical protein A3D87_04035 [Omnitrophica WOR_2 bacterium RIFCSPHIGHO2_02_FULL_50_17]OGX43538.1 MAG: hypothetical protein A3G91_01835 [Omnitrophica WOR_2 bacterium RIFCSPLOWO2_12_FULL_50_9]